jgi:hypothetical protein
VPGGWNSVSIPTPGKADTRWLQATDPWLSPGLGKADTRPGKSHGSVACATAPERLVGRYRNDQGGAASHARRFARRTQPDACEAGRDSQVACRTSPSKSGGNRPQCSVARETPCGDAVSAARRDDRFRRSRSAIGVPWLESAFRRSQRCVRHVASGRSGTFPRARVCLSKLGERSRVGRLQQSWATCDSTAMQPQ